MDFGWNTGTNRFEIDGTEYAAVDLDITFPLTMDHSVVVEGILPDGHILITQESPGQKVPWHHAIPMGSAVSFTARHEGRECPIRHEHVDSDIQTTTAFSDEPESIGVIVVVSKRMLDIKPPIHHFRFGDPKPRKID